jgi:Holliday junction resolvase RusA-like endonuclease
MQMKMEEEEQRRLEALEDKLKAVAGRAHMEVQTDDYLEDLEDGEVFEQEMGVQTDFPDIPKEVETYPHPYAMRGESKATCIEGKEIFDFDDAVEPILETLLGKALGFGFDEILEEEEMKQLQRCRRSFLGEQQSRAEAILEMERQAQFAFEAKEAHLSKERQRFQHERTVAHKLAAGHKARRFLDNLQSNVFDELTAAGFFIDPQQDAVEAVFMPFLVGDVKARLSTLRDSQDCADSLIYAVLNAIQQEKKAVWEAKMFAIQEKARLKQEAEEARAAAEKQAAEDKAAAEAAAAAAAAAAADNEGDNEGDEEEEN